MALIAVGLPFLVRDAETSASATTRPNVVVIITDDQDAASLPVMRKLMAQPGGSWVNFTNGFINDSICCPARATMLTGQYAHHHGVIGNGYGNLLDDTNTLPVWLDQAGYQTGMFGKYLNGHPWDLGQGYVPPGWDTFKPGGGQVWNQTTDAVEFIQGSTSPYFAYVAYKAPHTPATPEAQYAHADVYVAPDSPNLNEADVSDKPRWVQALPLLTQPELDAIKAERLASQRELLSIDDGVQTLVDTVAARGELDNTMFVFMSDNGYSWGSHRYGEKRCAYEECSRIPFLVRYPGVAGSRNEARIVSNVDLPATIAEVAGVTPGLPQDGRSLVPLLTDTAGPSWADEVLLECYCPPTNNPRRSFGIRAAGWKYVEYLNTGDKELYDLTADPYELTNLAGRPEHTAEEAELTERLARLIGTPPPRPGSPFPPTGVTATAGDAEATVSFTPPRNDGGNAISSYTVTASPGGATATGSTSPLVVPGLTNGTAYAFTVHATNSVGSSAESAPSNAVMPDTAPVTTTTTTTVPPTTTTTVPPTTTTTTPVKVPDPPTGVTATAGDARATVSFIPPASDGGAPITSYTVTASPDGATATGSASPITVAGLTNGTAYTFTVRATNSVGPSAESAPSKPVTPTAVTTALAPPTGLTATATASNRISLTWNTVPNATNYRLRRGTAPGGPYNAVGYSSSGTFVDSGLLAETTYYYVVQAMNETAVSGYSNEASATTMEATVKPSIPTGVIATTVSSSQINVTWNAVSGATSYRVLRATLRSGPYEVVGTPTEATFDDIGLTAATKYFYMVRAVNAAGTSGNSAKVTATTSSASAASAQSAGYLDPLYVG